MTDKDFRASERIKSVKRISWTNENGVLRWIFCVEYKPTGSRRGMVRRFTWADRIPFSVCAFLENAKLAWSYEFEPDTLTEYFSI